MKIVEEFKEFIARGNVIDLAVGVILGASFGKIVSALVDGVVMPPIGLLLGRVNFSDLFWPLDGKTYDSLAAAETAGAPVIAYGAFASTVIQFVIVAACVFAMVKAINRIKRTAEKPPEPEPAPGPTESEKLLGEIRDLLKNRPAN